MTRIAKPFKTGLLSIVIMLTAIAIVHGVVGQGYNGTQTSGTYPGNLVLNIYIDEAGRALVTGYADVIDGLSFLNNSQYKYDKDSKQLYALTNSLTFKSGDDWETKIISQRDYSEYHSTFYLPSTVKISRIEYSSGLEYLVSASNDSFQVDLHGYDVLSPAITIDYQLPLKDSDATIGSDSKHIIPFIVLFGFALISVALLIWMRQRKATLSSVATPNSRTISNELDGDIGDPNEDISMISAQGISSNNASGENIAQGPEDSKLKVGDLSLGTAYNPVPLEKSMEKNISKEEPDDMEDYFAETIVDSFAANEESQENGKNGLKKASIEITSEMAAVMETLTAREKTVLAALIENNGKMNQADIRYETNIPKSSLTGILLSLERRKLITKKERGRTNIIELSGWFLSKKEPS